jgi:hypothetical protein
VEGQMEGLFSRLAALNYCFYGGRSRARTADLLLVRQAL